MLRHQAFTLGVAVVTMVATIWLYIIVPKGLLPSQDTGMIIGVTDAAQSISFKDMVTRQRAIAEIVQRDPDVVSVASFVGAGSVNPTVNSGRLYINLKPRDSRQAGADEIIARLRAATDSVQGISLFMQAAQDVQIDSRISRTQYQYTLTDADEVELSEWAPKLLNVLRNRPELVDVASDQQSGGLQVSVEVDREGASRLNVLTQAIDDTLYDAFGQRQVSTIFTQLNQYRVVLEVEPQYQFSPDSLNKIYVKSSTGQMVPLSAFAKVKIGTAPLAVVHQGQFPAVTLSFNLRPGGSLGAAVEAIQAAQKEIGLPDTVVATFSGSAAEFQSSLKSEPFLILAAIIVIYIVLGVLYESYVHPITILSSLPSAGVGALLALLVCGENLSLVALIGIILLIGIVQKNAIMMIDFALDAERTEGLPPVKSIYQACLLRFRPIMMTTMAALLGALPLALQRGTGSELRRPLGIAIVGGLLLSQLITLYTTPVVYLYLDRLAHWVRRGRPAPEPRPNDPARPGRSAWHRHAMKAAGILQRTDESGGEVRREGRSQKAEAVRSRHSALPIHSDFGLRTSDFLRPSTFGLRTSPGMNICAPFIRRPVGTSLLAIGLFMAGIVAFRFMPVAAIPRVDFPMVMVAASLPGADPATVASSLAAPLERRLAQIAGVTEITSASTLGGCSITIQFDLNRNVDGAARDVQAAINASAGDLPINLPSPPTYRKINPADAPVMILAMQSDILPPVQVFEYGDSIIGQRLSQVEGVSQVFISGADKSAVRVQVNPGALASTGMSLEDVRSYLGQVNVDSPKGSFDGDQLSYTLVSNDQLLQGKGYQDLILTQHSNAPIQTERAGPGH